MGSYLYELKSSKKKEDKDLRDQYATLNEDLLDELLILYLERVKFIHCIAFM